MFPTTVWTMIRDAGGEDADAWEGFAHGYRRPVLDYIRGRVGADDAEDLCQEVFVRLFRDKVLKKADRDRRRFRSLLLTGESVNRNKLWIARGKLSSLIRKEVALTCSTPEESEEEVAYLSRYLRPSK